MTHYRPGLNINAGFKRFEELKRFQMKGGKLFDCSLRIQRYKELKLWGSNLCPVVIVPPEIHPLSHLKDTATIHTHKSTHMLPEVVIQFERLGGRHKEIEGGKVGSKGVKGSYVRTATNERRGSDLSLSLVCHSVGAVCR